MGKSGDKYLLVLYFILKTYNYHLSFKLSSKDYNTTFWR